MRRATRAATAGDWPDGTAAGSVTLGYDERHRRHVRLTTDAGQAILLDLEAAVLLRLDDGSRIRVCVAPQDVVDARGDTVRDTARLAWHLGNRHLPVQILRDGGIRFRHDHVIEAMVRGLGGQTERKRAPFTPEGGACGHRGHDHPHGHGDD